MTIVLWSWLLLDAFVPGRDHPRPDLLVTASDPSGGEDAGLANALAQALIDAGLPARRSRELPATDCRGGCVRVFVRAAEQRRFTVEVRAGSEVAHTAVQLDPSASSFDRAHALAIEVEMLTARAHVRGRAPVRPAIAMSAGPPGARPPEAAPPVTAPPEARSPESPLPDGETASALEPPPASNPPTADQPAQSAPTIQTAPATQPAPPDTRVALNVAAHMLIAPSGGLAMHGSTLGARVVLGRRLDLRAGISFLRPQYGGREGVFYHRELLPLQLSTTLELPHLSSLRAGGGVEAFLVSGEEEGMDVASAWSLGATGRIEYRHAIRSFALMSSFHAAFHPASWSTNRDPGPLFAIPSWTIGVSLGLEFRIY